MITITLSLYELSIDCDLFHLAMPSLVAVIVLAALAYLVSQGWRRVFRRGR